MKRGSQILASQVVETDNTAQVSVNSEVDDEVPRASKRQRSPQFYVYVIFRDSNGFVGSKVLVLSEGFTMDNIRKVSSEKQQDEEAQFFGRTGYETSKTLTTDEDISRYMNEQHVDGNRVVILAVMNPSTITLNGNLIIMV